ncbi:uncharacterized protein LOC127801693 [Diospyros lotus]|uniref:uncharacterized protein LOC127801693 n=1 Tax=Diospyros lotus TaxID=55363 RepID=UPI0022543351|nr:uncharacterized protein LOC127801693 [Diospyros lotus]
MEYRRGKKNVVANALSKKEKVGQCQAISVVVTKWMKEVTGSYEQTPWVKDLMASLAMQPSSLVVQPSGSSSAINRSPFKAVFGYKPSLIPALSSATTTMATMEQYLRQKKEVLRIFKKELSISQNRMKQHIDQRSDWSFEVGDRVFLRLKRFLKQPFTTIPSSKLSPKYFNPYEVESKVGKVAYKLRLPEGVNVHLVFHLSFLKKSIEPYATISPDLPLNEEEKGVVEPQAILDRKVLHPGSVTLTQVLVWTQKDPNHTT